MKRKYYYDKQGRVVAADKDLEPHLVEAVAEADRKPFFLLVIQPI